MSNRINFRNNAQAINVVVNGTVNMTANVKEFSTGSCGWYVNGKIDLDSASEAMSHGLSVKIGQFTLTAAPKEYASGNCGWYANGKVMVGEYLCQVGGNFTIVGSKNADFNPDAEVKVQIGINITIIGSKHWAKDEEFIIGQIIAKVG